MEFKGYTFRVFDFHRCFTVTLDDNAVKKSIQAFLCSRYYSFLFHKY